MVSCDYIIITYEIVNIDMSISMAGKISGERVGKSAGDIRPDALHGLQRSDVGKVHFGKMRQGDDLRSQ